MKTSRALLFIIVLSIQHVARVVSLLLFRKYFSIVVLLFDICFVYCLFYAVMFIDRL